MNALVAVWFCGCTTAAEARAKIPDRCTHHDAALTCEPVDQEGPVALGHDCSLRDCSTGSPTDRPALTLIRGAA